MDLVLRWNDLTERVDNLMMLMGGAERRRIWKKEYLNKVPRYLPRAL